MNSEWRKWGGDGGDREGSGGVDSGNIPGRKNLERTEYLLIHICEKFSRFLYQPKDLGVGFRGMVGCLVYVCVLFGMPELHHYFQMETPVAKREHVLGRVEGFLGSDLS